MRNFLHIEEELSLIGFWSCGKAEEKSVRKFVGKWWESFTQGCGKAHFDKKNGGKVARITHACGEFYRGFCTWINLC